MWRVMAASAAAAAEPASVAVAGVVQAAERLSVAAGVGAAALPVVVAVAAVALAGRLLVPEEPEVAPVAAEIVAVGL